MNLRKLLWIILVLVPTAMWAQVRFVLEAPRRVSLGEQFEVAFVLYDAEGSNFRAPSITDFSVLAGPSTSTSTSYQIINGKTSRASSQGYRFLLTAKREGKLRIPAASIVANGKTVRTQPMVVEVSGGGNTSSSSSSSAAAPAIASDQLGARDLYIEVVPSKREVYEQEPIMLTYYVYAAKGVGLSSVSVVNKPDFKGFWTQEVELPRSLQAAQKQVGGRTYQVARCLQFLVFPQQVGRMTIPSTTFACELPEVADALNPFSPNFNPMAAGGGSVMRHSPEVSIQVLPLPNPRPSNFSGGVGQLSVRGELLNAKLRTNDIATYRLRISGRGNLQLVSPPQLTFPKTFDTFSPKMQNHTRVGSDGLTGEVYFDYNFVPRNVGTFSLAASELVYFDTSSRSYRTLSLPAQTWQVEQGTQSAGDLKEELVLRNSDIREIIREPGTALNLDSPLWLGSWSYVLLLLAMLGGGGLALHYGLRKASAWRNDEEQRMRKAGKRAHRRLRKAQAALQTEGNAFYDELDEALRAYFVEKYGLSAATLTQETIVEALQAQSAEPSLIEELRQLFGAIDFGRFAPADVASNRAGLLSAASQLLDRLEQTTSQ